MKNRYHVNWSFHFEDNMKISINGLILIISDFRQKVVKLLPLFGQKFLSVQNMEEVTDMLKIFHLDKYFKFINSGNKRKRFSWQYHQQVTAVFMNN